MGCFEEADALLYEYEKKIKNGEIKPIFEKVSSKDGTKNSTEKTSEILVKKSAESFSKQQTKCSPS